MTLRIQTVKAGYYSVLAPDGRQRGYEYNALLTWLGGVSDRLGKEKATLVIPSGPAAHPMDLELRAALRNSFSAGDWPNLTLV